MTTDTLAGHAYGTKLEVAFSTHVIPLLQRLDVEVDELQELPGSGELNVTLYLPSHDRDLRETVIRTLQDFERSHAFTTSVSPMLLHAEDRTDER